MFSVCRFSNPLWMKTRPLLFEESLNSCVPITSLLLLSCQHQQANSRLICVLINSKFIKFSVPYHYFAHYCCCHMLWDPCERSHQGSRHTELTLKWVEKWWTRLVSCAWCQPCIKILNCCLCFSVCRFLLVGAGFPGRHCDFLLPGHEIS